MKKGYKTVITPPLEEDISQCSADVKGNQQVRSEALELRQVPCCREEVRATSGCKAIKEGEAKEKPALIGYIHRCAMTKF